MIDTERIREIIDEKLAGTDLFLVGIRQSPSNEIEITIDSDTSVGIDRCAELSRAVEEAFDRDAEDFELTVMSAGIGQPLTMLRQYRKLIGREVEAVLKDGSKLTAVLKDASAEALTLSYSEKVAVEGKNAGYRSNANGRSRSRRSRRPANTCDSSNETAAGPARAATGYKTYTKKAKVKLTKTYRGQ